MAAPPEIARENGKKGGRPPGRKNDATLKREAVLKAMQQRIMTAADLLLDSQFTLARGCSYLYKIEKYFEKVTDDKGKTRRVLKRKPPKLVTDEWEIREYLAGVVDESELEDDDPTATYYFITTEKPDNRAIDSLYARTFGRAVQPVALTDSEGNDLIDDDSKTKTDKALREFIGRHPRARRRKGN